MHLNVLAKKLRVSADEVRLHILCALFRRGTLCVSEIAHEVHESVASTSHHLQVLADEGLLESTRDGKRICYSLSDVGFVKDLKGFICKHHNLHEQHERS